MAKGSGYREDHNTVYDALNPSNSHRITTSGTTQQTGVISQGVNWVKVFSTEHVWIKMGTNPEAEVTPAGGSGSSFFHQGGTSDYYIVRRQKETDEMKIAVIQHDTSGDFIIVEGS